MIKQAVNISRYTADVDNSIRPDPVCRAGFIGCIFMLMFTLLLVSLPVCGEEYRTLKTGDQGEDVYRLKERMYYLGYFTSLNISDKYNDVTAERICQLQRMNSLEETGIADAALQELIYSDRCVWKGVTPKPSPTPALTPVTTQEMETEVIFSEEELNKYRTLKNGDNGEDVLALKQRMYALGYFTTGSLNDRYTDATESRVKKLQKLNGMEETGIATPELQEYIFSDQCKWTGTTPRPTKTPTPTATPMPTPTLPPMTEDHFLDAAEAGQHFYICEDEKAGVWRYIDSELCIYITQHYDKATKIRWYEAEIWCSPEQPLGTLVTDGKTPGKARKAPKDIVNLYHPVLAISDDYYAHRMDNKETVGIIIRNGQIISEKTVAADKPRFPNLEVLAVYRDGSMKTFLSNAYTAQEYIDSGATNVFAFGPILVRDGQLGPHMTDNDYYYYKEPRMAIGMIEPYHYLIVAVDGRLKEDGILGCHLQWMAQLMLDRGCTEALNLDGGGTACLMFMGKRLNKTGSSIRSLGSMIYFGTTDQY